MNLPVSNFNSKISNYDHNAIVASLYNKTSSDEDDYQEVACLDDNQHETSSDEDDYQEVVCLDDSQPVIRKAVNPLLINIKDDFESIYLSNTKPFIYNIATQLSTIDNENLKLIGSGNFKNVYKMTFEFNKKEKVIALATKKIDLKPSDETAFNLEVDTILEIAPKNIKGVLPIYGLLKAKGIDREFIISKMCTGDLQNKFKSLDFKMKSEALKLAWLALQSFHQFGYAHRDIKSSNFLLKLKKNGTFKVYLSDFGLASKINHVRKGLRVNFSILDPFAYTKFKTKQTLPSNPKSDTWAFGLMICELFRNSNSENKFDGDGIEDIEIAFQDWTRSKLKLNPEHSQEIVNEFIDKTPFPDEKLKAIVQNMMAYYPDARPSDEEISKALDSINS